MPCTESHAAVERSKAIECSGSLASHSRNLRSSSGERSGPCSRVSHTAASAAISRGSFLEAASLISHPLRQKKNCLRDVLLPRAEPHAMDARDLRLPQALEAMREKDLARAWAQRLQSLAQLIETFPGVVNLIRPGRRVDDDGVLGDRLRARMRTSVPERFHGQIDNCAHEERLRVLHRLLAPVALQAHERVLDQVLRLLVRAPVPPQHLLQPLHDLRPGFHDSEVTRRHSQGQDEDCPTKFVLRTRHRHRPRNAMRLSLARAACRNVHISMGIPPAAPREDAKRAERAIADAVDAGAAQHAPSELALARDKLSLAARLIDNGADSQVVVWLLEQSQVDAELAAAKSMRISFTR